MKRTELQQLIRVWKARALTCLAHGQVGAEMIYRHVVDELSTVVDGGSAPLEPAHVDIRIGGELTRAELESYTSALLTPIMAVLERQGIVVSIVAAPARDPLDGKAVVASSTRDVDQMREMFEQAAARLRAGRHFELPKS
jgi:hypothetical protein